LGTEGQQIGSGAYSTPYSKWEFSVKYGLGMGYYLSKFLHLEIQGIYNQVFSDYLDDVSGYYPDYNELEKTKDGEAAIYFAYGGRDGSQISSSTKRGNDEKNDGFITFGVKVTYIFGKSEFMRFMKL
jgi:hypothetical protein